ncbi:MAG: hypothetical protein ACI9VR_002071 [Cognaticolwellia sp.]
MTTEDSAGGSDSDSVDIEVGGEGTVLILHMDETSGTSVSDSSWSGNDGSANNGDWRSARFFGGIDSDTLTVPYSSDLALASEFTIEWWMRPDVDGSIGRTLFSRSSQLSAQVYEDLLGFYGLNGSSYSSVVASTSMGDGEWHHYAVTYDPSTLLCVVYEDGVGIASGNITMSSSTDDLTIGVNGYIDEFIVHETALSSTEMVLRYSDTTQFCSGEADTTPPTATITSPSSGASTTDGVATIKGTASDESEITSLTVAGYDAVSTSGNFDTWVAYVELSTGSNTIEVDTEDIAGNTDSAVDSVTVSYADTCYDDYSLFLSWDEDTGALASDYSDNGLDATESGTDRLIGVYGNSASFDGSSYASIAHDAALSYSGAFTADFWYKRDGATSDVEVLFHKGVYNYAAALDGSDLFCLVRDSSSTDWTATATGYNDGDWHHVVCNYTGSKLRLYVDGAIEDTVTVGATLSTNSDGFYVGAANGSANFFEGEIDDLRVRESTYTGAKLKALYSEGEVCTVSENLAVDGTASASSSLSVNYPASSIIDEQLDEDDATDLTYWLLSTGTTGYITVELADYVGVTRLRWVNTTHAARYTYASEDYEIYASTNGDFLGEEELIASGTGDQETDLRYRQVGLSTPVSAKYIRFYVDSYHGKGGGLNEIEVYGLE